MISSRDLERESKAAGSCVWVRGELAAEGSETSVPEAVGPELPEEPPRSAKPEPEP